MFCQACGTTNAEIAVFCVKCGQRLEAYAQAAAAGGGSVQAPYGPLSNSERTIRKPGEPARVAGRTYAVDKNAFLAVLLSFILPGLGQLYNGDAKRGAIMLVCAVVSGFLTMAFGIGYATGICIWIWSIFNAYNVAAGKTALAQ